MDTVQLAFTLASLNNLKACAADVGNTFLYGRTCEKVAIKVGPEFGNDKGVVLAEMNILSETKQST